MTTRRGFITGLISLAVTAPAIVRATSLMPVKAEPPLTLAEYLPTIGYRTIGIGGEGHPLAADEIKTASFGFGLGTVGQLGYLRAISLRHKRDKRASRLRSTSISLAQCLTS